MRIRSLSLSQFRNYTSQEVVFDASPVQLLIGENGSGKTNVLEAMSILSMLSSCRGAEETDVVQWEKDFYRLRAEVEQENGERHVLEAVTELQPRKRRAFFIDDVRMTAAQMVGRLPTVTFLPEDILLFSGAPQQRRAFLDNVLTQVSVPYAHALAQYKKLLAQRNALLKRIADRLEQPDSLEPWDREIAPHATLIMRERTQLITTFNLSFTDELQHLGESWKQATLQPTRPPVDDVLTALRERRDRDCLLCTTTVGPHRDDWFADIDGRNLVSFASRGQERAAVLALLLLSVSYLEVRTGEKPVILLDDAFSELDDRHRLALLSTLQEHQVFLTTTHLPPHVKDAAVLAVAHGTVTAAEQPAAAK